MTAPSYGFGLSIYIHVQQAGWQHIDRASKVYKWSLVFMAIYFKVFLFLFCLVGRRSVALHIVAHIANARTSCLGACRACCLQVLRDSTTRIVFPATAGTRQSNRDEISDSDSACSLRLSLLLRLLLFVVVLLFRLLVVFFLLQICYRFFLSFTILARLFCVGCTK